jgi:hypothetical protein
VWWSIDDTAPAEAVRMCSERACGSCHSFVMGGVIGRVIAARRIRIFRPVLHYAVVRIPALSLLCDTLRLRCSLAQAGNAGDTTSFSSQIPLQHATVPEAAVAAQCARRDSVCPFRLGSLSVRLPEEKS